MKISFLNTAVFKRTLLMLIFILFCTPFLCTTADARANLRTDTEQFEKIIESYCKKQRINPDCIYIGYKNTVTGEELYYRGGEYVYCASIYKLPLNMYYSELVSKGEMQFTDLIGTNPYGFMQEHSLRYSNNVFSMFLKENVGAPDDYGKAVAPYLGTHSKKAYYDVFTPYQIINCLEVLYAEPDRFPGVLENLLLATPGMYFEKIVTEYEIAQKYGHDLLEEYGLINEHAGAAGIIYAEEPFLLMVMTKNCSAEMDVAKICEFMCWFNKGSAVRMAVNQNNTSIFPHFVKD